MIPFLGCSDKHFDESRKAFAFLTPSNKAKRVCSDMKSNDVSTVEKLEEFALEELERFCRQLGEEGRIEHRTHLVVKKNPETGEELAEPRLHQIVYDPDVEADQIHVAEQHMATTLNVSGSVHLWHDVDSSQVIVMIQHADGVKGAARAVTRTKEGVQFGELCDLFTQETAATDEAAESPSSSEATDG